MNWLDLPPLSSLRAFSAYAQTRSISQAGVALNVSHAAISQQMRSLEAHLGIALLDRSRRQLSLTPEGETLARTLEDAFAAMAQTCAALSGADADRPLHISTTPSFAAGWLMPRLARFREKHPEISLMIDPSAQVQRLEPGGFDAALRYGSGDWPGLESNLVIHSPISVVASPKLVKEDDVSDLSALTKYHWLQELGTNETSDWFARLGVNTKQSPPSFSAMPGNLLLEAARQGQGIAITARVFAEPDVSAGRLRILLEDNSAIGYFLVTRPGVMRPPLKAFATWVRREARRDEPALPSTKLT